MAIYTSVATVNNQGYVHISNRGVGGGGGGEGGKRTLPRRWWRDRSYRVDRGDRERERERERERGLYHGIRGERVGEGGGGGGALPRRL